MPRWGNLLKLELKPYIGIMFLDTFSFHNEKLAAVKIYTEWAKQAEVKLIPYTELENLAIARLKIILG